MNSLITKNIKQGVNLHFIPADRFKTVNLSFHLTRPLNRKEVTYNSLIPAILRRGCAAYPQTRDLNIYLEELYGASFSYTIRKKGNAQVVCLNFKTIADPYTGGVNPFDKLLDLARNIIFCPVTENGGFSSDYTRREKENLKQFIEGIINEKREYAQKRMIEEMYQKEAFGIFEYGYVEDLEKITPQNLYEHYTKIITTSPMDIFVTGYADIPATTEKISSFFQGNTVATIPFPETLPGEMPKSITYKEETEPITQGKLSIGLRTEINRQHPLFFAMLIANNLFGGSTHSKLFVNVREKLSLAYYAGSGYNSYKGLIIVNCGIEFDKYEITKKEVLSQLEELKSGHFTDEELEFSKLSVNNAYQSAKDSAEAMEDFYSGQILAGTNDSLEDVIHAVSKVTKEDVIAAAKTIFADTVFFLKGSNA